MKNLAVFMFVMIALGVACSGQALAPIAPYSAASNPSTCTVNQVYLNTSTTPGTWFQCTATNTWAALAGGSGNLGVQAITGTNIMTYGSAATANVYTFTMSTNVTASSPSTNPAGMVSGQLYQVEITGGGSAFTISGGPSSFENFPLGTIPAGAFIDYQCVWNGTATACRGGIAFSNLLYTIGAAVAFSSLPATCPANVPLFASISDSTVGTLGAAVTVGGGSTLVSATCFTSGGSWIVTGTATPSVGGNARMSIDFTSGGSSSGFLATPWYTDAPSTGVAQLPLSGFPLGSISFTNSATPTATSEIRRLPHNFDKTQSVNYIMTGGDSGGGSTGTVVMSVAIACFTAAHMVMNVHPTYGTPLSTGTMTVATTQVPVDSGTITGLNLPADCDADVLYQLQVKRTTITTLGVFDMIDLTLTYGTK